MSTTVLEYKDLAIQALSLSMRERAELAASLIGSLQMSPPLSEEQQMEIVRERVRKLDAGEEATVPFEQAMQGLREEYDL